MEFPGNPPNSTGDKTPKANNKAPKNIQKVVTETVIKRKAPLGRRFKEVFFGGDARSAGQFVFRDVLLPALKNMAFDSVNRGSERMIYGDRAPQRRTTGYSGGDGRPRVSYNNQAARASSQQYRPPSSAMLPDQPPHFAANTARTRKPEASDVIIASRTDAEEVLERLQDIIRDYDVASVADFYDLLGLPTHYQDNKWGWSGLMHVDIQQVRDGYVLLLPTIEPID